MMNTTLSFTHAVPTVILFGAGKLNELSKQAMPGKKALIVISHGKSTRANGYLTRLEEQLGKAGVVYALFDGVQANPTKDNVQAGAKVARENGCDFIVALGGGSVMDASKAIGAMAVNDGDLWDYIQFGTGGKKRLAVKPLPIVAITTTAGTGSESDCGAVITNENTHEKTGFIDPLLFPVLAVVDPELMLSVPPEFTAYQGFDALFHSVEGFVCNCTNLLSDMYAITAIENVGAYLPRAVANGSDLEARTRMAFANSLSGTVMCVGACNSEHALEHALSAYHPELPHGAGLIMISKAYYTFLIEKHVADDRFVRMAQALGMADAKEPMDFIQALTKLQKECGVADLKMADYGITPEEFPMMARNAKATMEFLFDCDRIELTNDDCETIYQKSYK